MWGRTRFTSDSRATRGDCFCAPIWLPTFPRLYSRSSLCQLLRRQERGRWTPVVEQGAFRLVETAPQQDWWWAEER